MIKELDQAITREGIYCREKESKGKVGGEMEKENKEREMKR